MSTENVISQAKAAMAKAVDHTISEFNTIHTGKASPAMVETISVEAYGSTMKLNEVAAITTPDARTISIQPFDKSTQQAIEKAIQVANLGLNPIARGATILCPLPELSGERRKELVKMTHNLAEQGKVGVRAARRDAMDTLKKLEKDKEISEDDHKRAEKEVQAETDKFAKEIETLVATKEKELLQV